MMVFVGGTPIGGPIMGWITDTYGARAGFLSGGLISAGIALAVGLVLARGAGLRLRVDLRGGWRPVRFVPVGTGPAPAAGVAAPAGVAAGASSALKTPAVPVRSSAVSKPAPSPASAPTGKAATVATPAAVTAGGPAGGSASGAAEPRR